MFLSPVSQWEKIFTKPFNKQVKFIQKVCKVNRRNELVLREAFFNNLSFSMVRQICKLVKLMVSEDILDYSDQEIIFDRLLRVIGISKLYVVEPDAEDNIISGEGYHVYSASYLDLDLVTEFINTHSDINSICDLGSGSGRALLYMALQSNHKVEFVGLELVEDRVDFTNDIAKYFNLKNIMFKTSDFLETPEDFEGFGAYYLYDPVGTDEVDLLISYFKQMIKAGHKFYIMFITGWDDLFLNALNEIDDLEKLDTYKSFKQEGRSVSFYKTK